MGFILVLLKDRIRHCLQLISFGFRQIVFVVLCVRRQQSAIRLSAPMDTKRQGL
jgi:hypothetical protein